MYEFFSHEQLNSSYIEKKKSIKMNKGSRPHYHVHTTGYRPITDG